LPKLIGEVEINQARPASQQVEAELQQIESALKESLSIVLPDAVGVAGRFVIVSQAASPFAEVSASSKRRFRKVHVCAEYI
jgi:hypothetical protein